MYLNKSIHHCVVELFSQNRVHSKNIDLHSKRLLLVLFSEGSVCGTEQKNDEKQKRRNKNCDSVGVGAAKHGNMRDVWNVLLMDRRHMDGWWEENDVDE